MHEHCDVERTEESQSLLKEIMERLNQVTEVSRNLQTLQTSMDSQTATMINMQTSMAAQTSMMVEMQAAIQSAFPEPETVVEVQLPEEVLRSRSLQSHVPSLSLWMKGLPVPNGPASARVQIRKVNLDAVRPES